MEKRASQFKWRPIREAFYLDYALWCFKSTIFLPKMQPSFTGNCTLKFNFNCSLRVLQVSAMFSKRNTDKELLYSEFIAFNLRLHLLR